MARKNKPALRWRSRNGIVRSGAFTIEPANNGHYLKFDGGYCNRAWPFATVEAAKVEADRLANAILRAMKPAT